MANCVKGSREGCETNMWHATSKQGRCRSDETNPAVEEVGAECTHLGSLPTFATLHHMFVICEAFIRMSTHPPIHSTSAHPTCNTQTPTHVMAYRHRQIHPASHKHGQNTHTTISSHHAPSKTPPHTHSLQTTPILLSPCCLLQPPAASSLRPAGVPSTNSWHTPTNQPTNQQP